MLSKDVHELILKNYRLQRILRINPTGWRNLKIAYIPFKAEERVYGESKFNLNRLVKLSVLGGLSVCSTKRFMLLVLLTLILIWGFLSTGFHFISIVVGICLLYLISLFIYISVTSTINNLELKKEY
jgi:hypothetical protein